MDSQMRIVVVGSGYVGLVAAVCFAELGHSVVCVDNDRQTIERLQAGDSLIHEKYLPELLARFCNNAVRFTDDLAEATRGAQAVFIAVGTPQSGTGDADLSYVEAVASEIARSLTSYTVIIEKSTVPVYTNEWIRRVLERNGVAGHMFDVVSNPEFLREGTAVSDFLHPDRIVVGTDSPRAAAVLSRIYAPLTLRPMRSAGHAACRVRLRCCLPRPRVPRSSSTRPTLFSR
jgi:UDPglucose 6-dehydrogenase